MLRSGAKYGGDIRNILDKLEYNINDFVDYSKIWVGPKDRNFNTANFKLMARVARDRKVWSYI